MITNATTTYTILSDQKVIDMADKIYLLEPNAAPLYVLVSKLNKRVAINTKIEWIEDVLNPSWTTLTADVLSTGTSITAADAIFNTNDLLKVPRSGEVMLVTSAHATLPVYLVTRGYVSSSFAVSSTAASAPLSANDNIVDIGSAFNEGSLATALTTMSTKTAHVWNYLQIFRKSVEITKTMANVELYGGADRPYQRKKKGIELMRDLERAFLFGVPNEVAATPNRTTGGIDAYIQTVSTAMGGAMTESEWEGWLRSLFRYGSNARYVFAAPIVLSVISLWAQGKLQMFPKDKTYGIAISQYISPHGTINLVKELMLENAGSPASLSYYGGYAFGLELEDIVYRYLQNRDVAMETDIQNPGDDIYKDQYICEVGMEFHNELKHGKVTGVTS
jgi:hypothetical protein